MHGSKCRNADCLLHHVMHVSRAAISPARKCGSKETAVQEPKRSWRNTVGEKARIAFSVVTKTCSQPSFAAVRRVQSDGCNPTASRRGARYR